VLVSYEKFRLMPLQISKNRQLLAHVCLSLLVCRFNSCPDTYGNKSVCSRFRLLDVPTAFLYSDPSRQLRSFFPCVSFSTASGDFVSLFSFFCESFTFSVHLKTSVSSVNATGIVSFVPDMAQISNEKRRMKAYNRASQEDTFSLIGSR